MAWLAGPDLAHQAACAGTHVSGYKARVQTDHLEVICLQIIGQHGCLCKSSLTVSALD